MDFSAGTMLASTIVSGIGMGVFVYGKKQTRGPQLLGGMALMMSPYVAGDPIAIYGAAAVIGLGVWIAVRAGL